MLSCCRLYNFTKLFIVLQLGSGFVVLVQSLVISKNGWKKNKTKCGYKVINSEEPILLPS